MVKINNNNKIWGSLRFLYKPISTCIWVFDGTNQQDERQEQNKKDQQCDNQYQQQDQDNQNQQQRSSNGNIR